MKDRILRNWNVQRVLFVVIGATIIGFSIARQEWINVLLGAYFASMGIFAFGCAAGNCYYNYRPTRSATRPVTTDAEFEEVKQD